MLFWASFNGGFQVMISATFVAKCYLMTAIAGMALRNVSWKKINTFPREFMFPQLKNKASTFCFLTPVVLWFCGPVVLWSCNFEISKANRWQHGEPIILLLREIDFFEDYIFCGVSTRYCAYPNGKGRRGQTIEYKASMGGVFQSFFFTPKLGKISTFGDNSST